MLKILQMLFPCCFPTGWFITICFIFFSWNLDVILLLSLLQYRQLFKFFFFIPTEYKSTSSYGIYGFDLFRSLHNLLKLIFLQCVCVCVHFGHMDDVLAPLPFPTPPPVCVNVCKLVWWSCFKITGFGTRSDITGFLVLWSVTPIGLPQGRSSILRSMTCERFACMPLAFSRQ